MWLLLLFIFYSTVSPVFATDYQQSGAVSITVSIEENRVTIFGHTSPKSRVELSSSKVFEFTYSDQDGYFVFDKTIIPKNPSDLCLTSLDNNQRSTSPVCIPPPPPYNYHTNIGPILLPPTISLENSQINPNATVITSGQAIPNSAVNIHFYKVNNSGSSFPKQVQAYSLPPITATSDSLGNFNLNLPTVYSSNYRLYASAKFEDNYSPKSNTLIYFLPSFFSLFLQQHPFLYFFLPLFIITLIIFLILIYLPTKAAKLSTNLPPSHLPAIPSYFPVDQNYFPPVKEILSHHHFSDVAILCQTDITNRG